MHPKDKVKAHLDKSIISSILQNARASLKEPSRPFTPSDQPRSLFSNSEVTRPPSSYNLKTFSKELEPIKAKQIQLEAPLVTGRKTVNESVKSGPRKPVKVLYTSDKVDRIVFDGSDVPESTEKGGKGEKEDKGGKIGENYKFEANDEEETSQWAGVIKKIDLIRYDSGFRNSLDTEALDEILQEFTESLAEVTYNPDPSGLISPKVLMKNLAMSLEAFQGDLGKILIPQERLNVYSQVFALTKAEDTKSNPRSSQLADFLGIFSSLIQSLPSDDFVIDLQSREIKSSN